MQISVVGIPESSRVASFVAALREAGLPEPRVHSWVDVLNRATPEGIVRLDSPGRNWNTEQRLLRLGAGETESAGEDWTRCSEEQVRTMGEPAGRIVAMHQWYLGWQRALRELRERVPGAEFLSAPEDVACLFDKERCQRRLEAAGCAMPRSFGVPKNFEDFWERTGPARSRRVFLKACHGSSASGVLALEHSRSRVQAFTTTKLAGGALWNSRPGYLLRDLRDIMAVVDAICRERAQAQAWVPKLGWRGRRIDLRIVTIGGRARHTVVRMSRTPFTNLQLRNQRGDVEAFAREHPAGLAEAKRQAELAAAAFPKCLVLGVDVALDPAERAWVLEANAFGDLLPGCLVEGWDTYRWQAEVIRERYFPAGN